nr:sensor domain-containing diguanylate cyclase [uncultured Undibacterium sp.]
MINTHEFLSITINSLTEHIVVIDSTGLIRFINRSWLDFAHDNSCLTKPDWEDVNYLSVCDAAAASGDTFGLNASTGLRKLIHEKRDSFVLEYPCHSPEEKRWFMMTAKPMLFQSETFFLVTHHDVTARKMAEEAIEALSRIDGLTKIANRRTFDEFFDGEWSRCARQQLPITLAMIDVDYFKLVNDKYGHHIGDECLVKIAAALDSLKKRPGDLCARYGGEEFIYVFGNTSSENALVVIDKLISAVHALGIPNLDSPIGPIVTVSAGLATIIPKIGANKEALIESADLLLYEAKRRGRNQVVSSIIFPT